MIPGGWREAKIREVAKIDVGRDLVEERFARTISDTHRFPIYSNTVEQHGHYGFYDFPEYSAESVTVVGRGIGLGTAFARKTPFGAIGRLLVLSPKDDSFDVGYLADYLNHGFEIHYESGGIPQLPGKTLGNYSILLPPLPEQRRIAEILSTWDRAIETVEALIANARAQKKALMQSLLTGKHRLPGFSGEWEVVRLGECAKSLDNRRVPINGEQRQSMQGNIPYYGANGVLDYVNDHIFDEPLVLLAEDGGYFDEYETRPIAQLIAGKSWVNNHAHILSNKPNATIEWLFFSLVHRNILDFINGGTRAKLNKSDMLKIPMNLPDVSEQNAICAILRDADREIELATNSLDFFLQEKSALMQQLLTGKRRVRVEEDLV